MDRLDGLSSATLKRQLLLCQTQAAVAGNEAAIILRRLAADYEDELFRRAQISAQRAQRHHI